MTAASRLFLPHWLPLTPMEKRLFVLRHGGERKSGINLLRPTSLIWGYLFHFHGNLIVLWILAHASAQTHTLKHMNGPESPREHSPKEMWSVDVQQQLTIVSGFWGLVLNLTLWSCRRQRGLNASLQLLHTSCSPHVFHSLQTQAKGKTAHTRIVQHTSQRQERRPLIEEQQQTKQGLLPLYI